MKGVRALKKQKAKRQQILDAAVRVIAENGYYRAQVSRIAKEAGVADGTIYLYFNNKEDLLVSLFAETMGSFVERIKVEMHPCTGAEAKLGALVRVHLGHLAERPHLAVLTQLELRQSQATLRSKISKILEPYLSLIEQIVELGIEEHVFHAEIDKKLARQMVFGTIDQVVTSWVMGNMETDLPAQANRIQRMLAGAFRYQNTFV